MALHPKAEETCSNPPGTYSDLSAVFLNTALTKGTEASHTEGLMCSSMAIIERNGIATELGSGH